MSLKFLKNKGVPFNNGILLLDYYLQLDQNILFNFKLYQDKNTSKIKYITSTTNSSNGNNTIYKTDDDYLNVFYISFDDLNSIKESELNSAEEYMYKIIVLFTNLVIDFIKNESFDNQQTMYKNLYFFLKNSIINTNTDDDIIIPFIDSKQTVNSKYKYIPVLLSEIGRGIFTDWDFLKELYKLDNFELFEKYRDNIGTFKTIFNIDLDVFNNNVSIDSKKSYLENNFIYSANLDESFNRVIEKTNHTKHISLFSDTTEIDLNNIIIPEDSFFELTLNNITPLRFLFNLLYSDSDSNYTFNSFDFEYTIYDNVFNRLDEHFEINLLLDQNYSFELELKNIKEVFYQEQITLTIDKFNIYYTKDNEIIKFDVIENSSDNIQNILKNIKLNNVLNTQNDVNFIAIQPDNRKIISNVFDERIKQSTDIDTVYLNFEILDCDIERTENNISNTITLNTLFDTSKIEIEDYYNGKEIQLSILNKLDEYNDSEEPITLDRNIINENYYINTSLVLFLTFQYSSNKFLTDLNFNNISSTNSTNNNLRVFVINNCTLFFDTQQVQHNKTNKYSFLLPCGKSYINDKKYFVGYNRISGYLEQFETLDSLDTLLNTIGICYEDEIQSTDITLDELITNTNFKLSENFNITLWNDFYKLYKDKKIDTINI